MSDPQFNRVRCVLYDPQYMNRQVTLGALQTLGLSQIEAIARTSDFASAIASNQFELVVAELQGGEDHICDMVRRVRHRMLGNNPFVVILLTTWDLNADSVRAVLNSGADDLVARPYTIAQIQQRLVGALSARKPFVVTADYIGPSRRYATREPEEGEQFEVPNPLRRRALGETDDPEELEIAWRNVLRWKAIRLGRQLEAAATALTKTAIPAGDQSAIGQLVVRIARTASELHSYALQASGPTYTAIAQFCSEMQRVSAHHGLGEAGLRQFSEFAMLIADQVRIAAVAEREGPSAGVVPFYIG